jgi:phage terminase large subunit GpA-like protein
MTAAVAASNATRIRLAWAEGIKPDSPLTVSAWADKYRKLEKKSSAEPGQWRTARTPYLKEILDCLSTNSGVEEVVLMKAAQIAGTEAILNAVGYMIDHAPGPILVVQPTVELAKRFSRQRLESMIRSTPRLAAKVAPSRMRDSGNTLLSKEFPGGILILTGANSAVGLRSIPARYLFCDEIDGYPIDVDEEGSPLQLAAARQRTFARRKRFYVSTPTIAGRSAIENAYETSDRRRYFVPCPYCEEMQPLEFSRLEWAKRKLPPEKAVYVCRKCERPIEERHKTQMLASGEWRAENPKVETRGYHLNALYAPVGWISWGDIASGFVDTYRDPDKYRVFVNTVLGEVWTQRGEAPEWEKLMARREAYESGTVPRGALFLTAGVDVQKDRLVVEIVGWGRGKQSWSIDYGTLPGDTADLERGPWKQLDELLGRTFPHADGADMPVRMLAVDSGYNTSVVYAWARRYPMNRVLAVKGQAQGGVLIGSPTAVEVTVGGRKLKRGGRVWPVCTPIAKSELYGWLQLEPPEKGSEFPPGFCHFPEYAEEYFKELTAEHLVAHKTRKGFMRFEWELIPGRANEMLDCRVYARAAASLAGLDRYRESDWAALQRALTGG